MTIKRTKSRYIYIVLAFVLLIASVTGGRCIPSAFADTGHYTSVLLDLQKDSNFIAADYSENANDYSVNLIQIAESADKELFVYTYQPSQKTTYFVATEINMSLSETVDGTQLYGLTLLNSDGVFCKYKVNDFTVSSDIVRYYNISSIYREWQKGIDEDTGNDNTKNAVAFNVGKLYKATTENGSVSYECKHIETIEIIDLYACFCEYRNGFYLDGVCIDPQWCDGHYVAFSTDKQIDYLLEADVTYIKRSCSKEQTLTAYTVYGDYVTDYTTVTCDQIGDSFGNGIFANKYTWKRIQSADDFIQSENLSDEIKRNLIDKKWVLRFTETERKVREDLLSSKSTLYWTEVESVAILRLKFVADFKVFNLGTVSDKVSSGLFPSNTNTDELANLFAWLERVTGVPQWVWILLSIIAVLAIVLPILSAIFPVVGQVLLIVFKALGTVICLPFKGIAALVRKIKNKNGGAI